MRAKKREMDKSMFMWLWRMRKVGIYLKIPNKSKTRKTDRYRAENTGIGNIK